MSSFIETDAPVLGFCTSDTCIFLLCGSELICADKRTGAIENRKKIFDKDGKARYIRTNGRQLAVSDFCTLILFDCGTLERLAEWTLGSDLSSDICGLLIDGDYIFACIRNGGLSRFDLSDISVSTFDTGAASSWSLASFKNQIIAGTVDGKLLCLDRESMSITARLELCRQNVRSLCISGDILYASGQDKCLYSVDLRSFELIHKYHSLHKKMYDIIGVKDGRIYTVSHPSSEISSWNTEGAKIGSLPYSLRLSGSSELDGDAILISSRSINGVDRLELSEIYVMTAFENKKYSETVRRIFEQVKHINNCKNLT